MFLNRGVLGVAVTAFWLLMMFFLARSELVGGFLRGDVVLDRAGWIDHPTENWLTIHGPVPQTELQDPSAPAFGPRVGYAHMSQRPIDRDGSEGAELTLDVQLVLQLLGRRAALEIEGTAWRARHQRLAHIDFAIRSGEANFELNGSIVDDAFTATITSGGEISDFSARLSDNALFSTGFGTALAFPPLELDEQIVLQSFDPMTLRATRAVVRAISRGQLDLDGTSVAATRLEVRSSGLRTIAWVDQDGQVLQATTPLGLSVRKSTRELALQAFDGSDNATELLRITAVKPTGITPQRGAQRLTVRIPGVAGFEDLSDCCDPALGAFTGDPISGSVPVPVTITVPATADAIAAAQAGQETLAIPLDWRQRLEQDGSFTFLASSLPNSSLPNADPSRPADSALTNAPTASALGSDAFIQADHPKIRQQAEAIVQAAADDLAKAFALHDWVFERLDKEPVLSLPSALEVLNSRRGDCNEHTILYTALARSVGLPTRVAIGLVWSAVYDGFYYHAWPEVWIAENPENPENPENADDAASNAEGPGSWIALDPTLGQPLADATHIKLLEGSIDQWPQLLPFLGQIQIEVLEASNQPLSNPQSPTRRSTPSPQ